MNKSIDKLFWSTNISLRQAFNESVRREESMINKFIDITMCITKCCPSFNKCQRAQCEPSMMQSCAAYDPGENEECESFISMYEDN